MSEAALGADAEAAVVKPVSTAYRRYALALLVAIYTVNFLDRSIVTNLMEDIKDELHLTDGQVGAMAGIYFALLYTILGIPIARWADKGDRPLIMTLSLTVWSGFTLLAGFAQNFAMLITSRIGVGVGEAGCTPTAHSLISDYTPRDRRATALAIYSMGVPIGTMLGMALGGLIAERYGWRNAFLVAGAPGLVFGVIALLTLREPRRALKAAGKSQSHAAAYIPLGQALKVLSKKPTFWFFALGSAFAAFIGYAHATFMASYFIRNHTPELTELADRFHMMPRGFLSTSLGLAAGIGGVVGSFVGGWFADRFGKKDLRFYGLLPSIAPFISTPIFFFIIYTDNMALALPLLVIPNIVMTTWYGPVYGGVQGLVPIRMRATTSAILLFIINIIGMGLGPTVFGMVSHMITEQNMPDLLASTTLTVEACKTAVGEAVGLCAAAETEAGAAAIKTTMYLSTVMLVPTIICFWLSRRTIRADMES